MKIKKVEIKNFRILRDVIVDFDDIVTLIVGKNNSGKTSLTEVFNNFFSSDKSKFRFEDFTLYTHKYFLKAEKRYYAYLDEVKEDKDDERILKRENLYKKSLPKIIIDIHLEYEQSDDGNLASISNFLMDLDILRKDVLISCEYGIYEPEKLFTSYLGNKSDYKTFLEYLRKNPQHFEKRFFAVDKNNPTYRSRIERPSEIENVFLPRFISAQNNLDDRHDDNSKGLSKGFESYYRYNKDHAGAAKDLKKNLETTSKTVDENYKDFFATLFNDLKAFGVNTGINLQEIEIKSHFDAEEILKENANLYYRHGDDNFLPEKSNGLGYSKLIYIVLTILSYYEEQSKRKSLPNFSLLFIEEPEAHLHPQMQQTFIKNINTFIKTKNWNVQIVITTHSPHIISDSIFDRIRYFDKSNGLICVKNLTDYKNSLSKTNVDALKFLKQYLTHYNCEMFFADKIIMVEG